jgi:flavin-binding protein dodecin
MAPNKFEQLFLRFEVRMFGEPHEYISELVTQSEENVDDAIKKALAKGRALSTTRALALVDELESAAITLDNYILQGKIDPERTLLMSARIQTIRRRLETYIPRDNGPRNDRDGDVLMPV